MEQASTPAVAPHIVPTVGRVVWYWPEVGGGDKNLDHDGEQPLRADVCHVNPDGTINLCVNDAAGAGFKRPNIQLHQGDAAGCSLPRPFATWMSYQLHQAEKTEAAEANVSAYDLLHDQLQCQLLAERVREIRLRNDVAEEINKPADQPPVLPEMPRMPSHQSGMRLERDELAAKIKKLKWFIECGDPDAFGSLDEEDQMLLREQIYCMQRYLNCLQDRIALLNEQQEGA